MGFMDRHPAKHVVTAKALDERLRSEIITACDFTSRSRGRPKAHLLGTEPVQMTLEIAARVVGLIVEQVIEEGGVFDDSRKHLYEPFGCRHHAQVLLTKLTKKNYGIVSDLPQERLWKMLGDLVPIGKRRIGDSRPQMHFVAKRGAGAMELQMAWNAARKCMAESEVRGSTLNDAFAQGLPGMTSDVPFSEYYANSLEEYHKRRG